MGVKAGSLGSDGESLLSPTYVFTVRRGREFGLSMASGTNGRTYAAESLAQILPSLEYLRFNVSAGTRSRYAEIMGTNPDSYDRVLANIRKGMSVE